MVCAMHNPFRVKQVLTQGKKLGNEMNENITRNQTQTLAAADRLFDALVALNDTDGAILSSGAPDKPFGAVEVALKITLVTALGESHGNLLYDMVIDAYEHPSILLSRNIRSFT
jgi:hypothetical protein